MPDDHSTNEIQRGALLLVNETLHAMNRPPMTLADITTVRLINDQGLVVLIITGQKFTYGAEDVLRALDHVTAFDASQAIFRTQLADPAPPAPAITASPGDAAPTNPPAQEGWFDPRDGKPIKTIPAPAPNTGVKPGNAAPTKPVGAKQAPSAEPALSRANGPAPGSSTAPTSPAKGKAKKP